MRRVKGAIQHQRHASQHSATAKSNREKHFSSTLAVLLTVNRSCPAHLFRCRPCATIRALLHQQPHNHTHATLRSATTALHTGVFKPSGAGQKKERSNINTSKKETSREKADAARIMPLLRHEAPHTAYEMQVRSSLLRRMRPCVHHRRR